MKGDKMDNGIRVNGQPIDEGNFNTAFGPSAMLKTNTLSSYLREKAQEFHRKAEDFDKCAELLENNDTLVNYIEGHVEGKIESNKPSNGIGVVGYKADVIVARKCQCGHSLGLNETNDGKCYKCGRYLN